MQGGEQYLYLAPELALTTLCVRVCTCVTARADAWPRPAKGARRAGAAVSPGWKGQSAKLRALPPGQAEGGPGQRAMLCSLWLQGKELVMKN